MNELKVTFLLLKAGKTSEWTITPMSTTLDVSFMQLLQQVSHDLIMQGSTVLRIEVVDKGTQVWLSFEDILNT